MVQYAGEKIWEQANSNNNANVFGSILKNVKSYGAAGNGSTDDTASIQSAIDAATDGGVVFFPAGTYKSGNLQISNQSNLIITGSGATITWFGTAASGSNIGFKFVGTCDNVTIENLTMQGDGVVANGHAGVWMASGQTISNLRVLNNNISNVITGISLNADLSGMVSKCIVQGNSLKDIVGSLSSSGYGIHLSNASQCKVIGNTIDNASRHSIYHAKGTNAGNIIAYNIVKNHRSAVADSTYRCGIAVTRSSNVLVEGNILVDGYDGGIEVSHDSGGYNNANITVRGNIFSNRKNGSANIVIGEQAVPGSYLTRNVVITENLFINDYAFTGSTQDIFILNGSLLKVTNNTFRKTGITGTARFVSLGNASFISSDSHCEDGEIKNNTFYAEGTTLTDVRAIDVDSNICTNTSSHVILDNRFKNASPEVYLQAAKTNKNLIYSNSSGAKVGTYTAGATTPSVKGISFMSISNSSATTITNLLDGVEGQELSLWFETTNTTLSSSNIYLAGAVNYSPPARTAMRFVYTGGSWREQSRSND